MRDRGNGNIRPPPPENWHLAAAAATALERERACVVRAVSALQWMEWSGLAVAAAVIITVLDVIKVERRGLHLQLQASGEKRLDAGIGFSRCLKPIKTGKLKAF